MTDSSPDPFDAAVDAIADASHWRLSPDIAEAIRADLIAEQDPYDGSRLRVGADLKPASDGCDRQTWYRLNGAERDEPKIKDLQRLEEGKEEEERLARALRRAGHEVETQVLVHPLRPSFWAWWPGHADILLTKQKKLLEVKVTSSARFDMAGADPTRLITPSHRHQLSHYHHELKRQGRVESSSWIVYDREHQHDPVEVPLTDALLVPLDEIVRLEVEKARLLTLTEAPPRPAGEFVVTKVLKGGRATKKNPKPERRVEAVERRFWGCSFCAYQGVCQPGPAETPVELAADDPRRVSAVAEAEAEWAQEDAAKKAAKDNGAGAFPTPAADGPRPTPVEETVSSPPPAASPSPEPATRPAEATPPPVLPDPPTSPAAACSSSLVDRPTRAVDYVDARPSWVKDAARDEAAQTEAEFDAAARTPTVAPVPDDYLKSPEW